MTSSSVEHDRIRTSDLVVGAVYRGDGSGTLRGEPLNAMLRCGNRGGFRIRGGKSRGGYKLAVLYTTFADRDWPDELDEANGRFLYFGDNKQPGKDLHDTARGGNRLLREVYAAKHESPARRNVVPPFFVFSAAGGARDVCFQGLAAPGAPELAEGEDLVAEWRTRGSDRFQNYRAVLTILDVTVVPRRWIDALIRGDSSLAEAPQVWRDWVTTGTYSALRRA